MILIDFHGSSDNAKKKRLALKTHKNLYKRTRPFMETCFYVHED